MSVACIWMRERDPGNYVGVRVIAIRVMYVRFAVFDIVLNHQRHASRERRGSSNE
jgi:hypothetical protein